MLNRSWWRNNAEYNFICLCSGVRVDQKISRVKTAPIAESAGACSTVESRDLTKVVSSEAKVEPTEGVSSEVMSQNDSFVDVGWDSPQPTHDSERPDWRRALIEGFVSLSLWIIYISSSKLFLLERCFQVLFICSTIFSMYALYAVAFFLYVVQCNLIQQCKSLFTYC